MNQNYGDRVISVNQGGFQYGLLGSTFTPNVVATYSATARHWSNRFGDLANVLYEPTGVFSLTLQADPGYLVQLHSFDLGGYPNMDYIIQNVQVRNENAQTLFNQSNVLVNGDSFGNLHTFVSLNNVIANSLTLTFNSTNLGASLQDEIGIDNIHFSQLNAVPEPSAFSLVCASTCLLAMLRKRKVF